MTPTRRAAAGLMTLGCVMGLLLAGTTVASAATDAYVRLAHLSPDTPQVDVYVASVSSPATSFVVPGVGYGAVSPYRPLPAGAYVVSMRLAGASSASPPVISTTVDARPGGAYTIAGTGMSAALGLTVIADQLTPPAAGKAAVRCVNGAASVPAVDVGRAGAEPWATDVRFATTTDYSEVPPGSFPLHVAVAGKPAVDLPVTLAANSVYTVLLVDEKGTLAARLILDSAGNPAMPIGSVETGAGGTARLAGPAPVGVAAAVLVSVMAMTVVAGIQRAHSR